MTLRTLTPATAPVGTLLLGLGSNGRNEFTQRSATVIVATRAEAEAFVASLPKTSLRRVFIRARLDEEGGGFDVSSDVWLLHKTAAVQFHRFVRRAARAGFTPAAAVVPEERRGVGQYAEVADIEAVFAADLR